MLLAALALAALASGAPAAAPPPPPGEMDRCYKLIQEKRYDAARERLIPLVAAHPGWQRATFMLALSYHEEQRYGEAAPLFARALAIDPQVPEAVPIHLFYGWCLYYLGQADAARSQFAAFAAARPADPDPQYGLGLLEFERDDIDAARARFASAIRLAQAAGDARSEGKARARLADVLVRTGELAAARDELTAAVRLRPDAYEAYFKLSRVLERLGDAEGAARALERHRTIRDQLRPRG